ncbi:hypothetical protein J132_10299 [Termitomyces sp. J132]|nr:hypothetical protein J132_10299 [Termitomyces sp. J132]
MNEDTHHPGTSTGIKPRLQHSPMGLPQHRLVYEYLSRSLDEFSEVRELVIAIRDASEAHGEAASLADTLHPDICPRNIKTQKDRDGHTRGYLIDWDHSTNIPQKPERDSTWQFTAVRLLRDGQPAPIQDRIDGVESFFHLLIWMTLRYTAHGMNNVQLTASLRHNFDGFWWDSEEGRMASSFRTSGLWRLGDLIFKRARFGNQGIRVVLRNMYRVLFQRYTNTEASDPDDSDRLLRGRHQITISVKEWALKSLDEPRWMPDLLHEVLEDEKIDWQTNKDRTEYEFPEIPLPHYLEFLY